ncbi:MAG: hypothetical protein HC853_02405 [Anaerolineae bacterium]|nr:hypothetical protein [Anaerolineae bacterium]
MKNPIWRGVCAALLGATLVANATTPVTATVSVDASQAPQTPTLAANKILVVTNNILGAPFGDYLVEILRAEGLNTIDVIALSAVTATDLTDHAVTVLAETALTAPQATLFTAYVNGGGRLLAMKPDPQIKGLFNLGVAAAPVSNGYVRINVGRHFGWVFGRHRLPRYTAANSRCDRRVPHQQPRTGDGGSHAV